MSERKQQNVPKKSKKKNVIVDVRRSWQEVSIASFLFSRYKMHLEPHQQKTISFYTLCRVANELHLPIHYNFKRRIQMLLTYGEEDGWIRFVENPENPRDCRYQFQLSKNDLRGDIDIFLTHMKQFVAWIKTQDECDFETCSAWLAKQDSFNGEKKEGNEMSALLAYCLLEKTIAVRKEKAVFLYSAAKPESVVGVK